MVKCDTSLRKNISKKNVFFIREIFTDDISIIFHFNTYDLVGQAKGLKLFSVTRKSSHMLAKYTWKIDVTFTTRPSHFWSTCSR